MDINNIAKLSEKPYMVSWKADGTRYLMLIEKAGSVYFIDRDNCVFRVEGMTFPSKKNFNEHLFQTLVDGVSIVINKLTLHLTKFNKLIWLFRKWSLIMLMALLYQDI